MSITEIVENLEDQVNNIENIDAIHFPAYKLNDITYRLNEIIDDLENLLDNDDDDEDDETGAYDD